LTAQDLKRRDLIPPDRILHWLGTSLELAAGGFRGASWDQQADVEYTFYGLGILGLLYAPNEYLRFEI
jgi:geranylgeranyl transferase type-2 subunit beta